MGIELRDYQKKQIEFLEKNNILRLPIAIESPTGSGKSVVILEYIKRIFEKSSNNKIVITTGFNNLVFDFYKKAKDFGLNPYVLIGYNLMKCTKYENSEGMKNLFTNDPAERCSSRCKRGCKNSINELKWEINTPGNKLIIMNHSSYLVNCIGVYSNFKPNITIVDESHTFKGMYESYLNTNITNAEIKFLKEATGNSSLFKMFSALALREEGSVITREIIDRLLVEIIKTKDNSLTKKNLMYKLKSIYRTKFDNSNILHYDCEEGLKKVTFYPSYDVKQGEIKYILFSATQDIFTRNMFGVPQSLFYKQRGLNIIDYSKSEYLIIKEKEFSDGLRIFLEECERNDLKTGMIISTTNKNVDYLTKNGFGRYKIYKTIDSFERSKEEYKILIGSKALYQGIDIYGLDFVALNRIPFEKYDELYKKKTKYLKDIIKMDVWTEYLMPEVANNIIQISGRIWRRPGDKGLFAIFDPRLDGRFKYFNDFVEKVRKGIKKRVLGEAKDDKLTEYEEIMEE